MKLYQYLEPYNLILASGSPRRSEILTKAAIPFSKRVIDIEEVFPEAMDPKLVPEYLAILKSKAHENTTKENEIILTADSIVILDNQILGKPTDLEHAKHIVQSLSGRNHTVVTGVSLWNPKLHKSFSAESIVSMAPLSNEEIDFYINNFSPLDKAGAYGIQDWIGFTKIKSIHGSFLNIMGLPMEMVYHALFEFIQEIKQT